MGKAEQWRKIENFDSYEISSCGRIRNSKNGNIRSPQDNGKGYYDLYLKQDGVKKKFYVHRLVAQAFIPNPSNKPCVNHIDNNPKNNNVDNLEWCTYKENYDWCAIQGRNKRTKKWISNLHNAQRNTYKPVIGINIKTGEILHFERLNGVVEKGFQPSCVCDCCNGKRNSHKGYRWFYETIFNYSG